jgi:hypothetical protein
MRERVQEALRLAAEGDSKGAVDLLERNLEAIRWFPYEVDASIGSETRALLAELKKRR